MRGLLSIPSLEERKNAYASLEQSFRHPNDRALSLEQWALWSQWTRFDPRLAELWIKSMGASWRMLHPVLLHDILAQHPWPNCAGVLLEQLEMHLLPKDERPFFRSWKNLVTQGFSRASYELYFIGTFSFGGNEMRKQSEEIHRSFLRWGYLGNSVLINKARTLKPFTQISRLVRKQKLDRLIRSTERIQVNDYLELFPEGLARRQAQLDLASHPGLRAVGNTRARFYVRKK